MICDLAADALGTGTGLIADLGCGRGATTRMLAERLPMERDTALHPANRRTHMAVITSLLFDTGCNAGITHFHAELVKLMDTLSAIKVPDDAGPFRRAEDRWKPYLDRPAQSAAVPGHRRRATLRWVAGIAETTY